MVTTEEYKKALNYTRSRLSHLGDVDQDAKDVLQDALIKLWLKKDPTNKYLYRYIQDSISALYVTRNAKKRQETEDAIVEELPTPLQQLEEREPQTILKEFLNTAQYQALPEQQRTVLELVAAAEDLVQTSLVAMYNMSKPLAFWHFNQAFKQFANYVHKEGASACNTSASSGTIIAPC